MSTDNQAGTGAARVSYRNRYLNELAALERNWDSYGAAPISVEALRAADAVSFLALSGGGVQIEARIDGWDFEIEINSDGKIESVMFSPVPAPLPPAGVG